ncbi:MAG: 50S ribosomal protein L11 methyltransferase [candidate division KSB1 bacterium]|nr:50S ribosomal protein L11 methyltransferase [candidate division KSB1 bacterium]
MGQNQEFYIQVNAAVTPENSEWISNELFELGASGIQDMDTHLLAFFQHDDNVESLAQQISESLHALRTRINMPVDIDVEIIECPVKDWRSEWKKDLKPIPVGQSLLIKPSWCDLPQTVPEHVIEIDPEMAFGSGTHATTFLILKALEHLIHPGCRVLDVGCGTGILSIAALKFGAASVFAFDMDPVAAQTTRRNADKNGQGVRIQVVTGTMDTVRKSGFDMILANVNRTQLLPLLARFSDYLNPGGMCLLSGILDTERSLFTQACHQAGLQVRQVRQRDEWLMFETVKN